MGKTCYYAYIGTNSVRGSRGIYTIEIDTESGIAKVVSTTPAYNSGGLALNPSGNCLYAVTEGMTFDGYAQGGITAYQTLPNGSLKKLGGQPSHGQRTCSLDVDGHNAYVSNFIYGTWSAYALTEDGAPKPARLVIGNPDRNAMLTGLHCIGIIENDYIGVIAIEHNELIIYRASDGVQVTSYAFPERTMPRSFISAGRFIYALMQMPDEVYVFENRLKEFGTIQLIQNVKLSDGAHRMGAASAIRITPNRSLVMTACRGGNTMVIFSRKTDGTLQWERHIELPGEMPRDFGISQDGEILAVAMQRSDEVCVMKIDYGKKDLIQFGDTVKVPSPAAVVISRRIEHDQY